MVAENVKYGVPAGTVTALGSAAGAGVVEGAVVVGRDTDVVVVGAVVVVDGRVVVGAVVVSFGADLRAEVRPGAD